MEPVLLMATNSVIADAADVPDTPEADLLIDTLSKAGWSCIDQLG